MRGEYYLLLLDLDVHSVEDSVEHHLAVGDALHQLVGQVHHVSRPAPARGPHLHNIISVKPKYKSKNLVKSLFSDHLATDGLEAPPGHDALLVEQAVRVGGDAVVDQNLLQLPGNLTHKDFLYFFQYFFTTSDVSESRVKTGN